MNGGDNQSKALLYAVTLVGYLLFFGIETKICLTRGNVVTPLASVVLFWYLAAQINYLLFLRRSRGATMILKGKKVRVPLRPANPAISAFVSQRARHFGITRAIHVKEIPYSWNAVDGYVAYGGREPVIVLTVGAQLLLNRSEFDTERLAFLIDHEIAHVLHNDVPRLLRMKAIIAATAILIPVKLWWVWRTGFGKLVAFYQELFPMGIDTGGPTSISGNDILIPRAALLPVASVLGILAIYALLLVVLLAGFYLISVRRREYSADAFAAVSCRPSVDPSSFLRSFQKQNALQTLPSHAFLGRNLWHPSLSARITSLEEARPRRLFAWEFLCGLLTVTLFCMVRFVFGNNGAFSHTNVFTGSQKLFSLCASPIFAWFLAFSVGAQLTPVNEGTQPGLRRFETEGRFLPLLLAATFLAVLLSFLAWSCQYIAQSTASHYFANAMGIKSTLSLEMLEELLLIWSLPLWICGVVFFCRSKKVIGSRWRMNNLEIVCTGALFKTLIVAFVVSLFAGGVIDATRDSTRQKKLNGMAGNGLSSMVDVTSQAFPTYNIVADDINQKLKIAAFDPPFYPPLSFVLLWQGPRRDR